MKSYEKKKKEMAEKSMPDPKVKKNVEEGDREAEMPCKKCGSKKHKTHEHKEHEHKEHEHKHEHE